MARTMVLMYRVVPTAMLLSVLLTLATIVSARACCISYDCLDESSRSQQFLLQLQASLSQKTYVSLTGQVYIRLANNHYRLAVKPGLLFSEALIDGNMGNYNALNVQIPVAAKAAIDMLGRKQNVWGWSGDKLLVEQRAGCYRLVLKSPIERP